MSHPCHVCGGLGWRAQDLRLLALRGSWILESESPELDLRTIREDCALEKDRPLRSGQAVGA